MACDLCGKSAPLHGLTTEYQTKDIKQICSDCSSVINSHLWKVRAMNNKLLYGAVKGYMVTMREKHLNK